MELRQLQYFLKVCETLHFSKAAAELNISQQPLSFQIHKLEEELGFELFNRTTRTVEITPAGAEFRKNIEVAMQYLKLGCENGKRISEGKAGKIRIGYNSLVFSTGLTHAINHFKELYHDAELDLVELDSPELEDAVLGGKVDIGIVGLIWHSHEELSYIEIAKEDSCIAIPKTFDILSKDNLGLDDIKGLPFITYSPVNKRKSYNDFIAICHQLGFEPNIIQTAATDLAVLGLVASGLGVAFVPACYRNIYSNLIVYKSMGEHNVPISLNLVWKEEFLQKKIKIFIDTISSYDSNRNLV